MGSIFADFNEYDNQTRNETSMAYVNVNYLKQQHIQNTQNKDIQISENETQRVVLVPENTSFSKQEIMNMTEGMYDISHGVKIIYYKDNQKFFTYNSQITENYTNMISYPIVQVLTNSNGEGSDYDRILAYKYSPYKIKASPQEIKDILNQYDLSQYVEKYITAYDEMVMLNHNEMIIFIAVTIVLITLIVLIVLIFVQNIQIYIHHHTKLLAVQTMNGYRLIDKYQKLIIMSITTLFLSQIIAFVLGYPIDYLMIIYLMLYFLFGLIFIGQTKKQERKSIILMLKGCE